MSGTSLPPATPRLTRGLSSHDKHPDNGLQNATLLAGVPTACQDIDVPHAAVLRAILTRQLATTSNRSRPSSETGFAASLVRRFDAEPWREQFNFDRLGGVG